MESACTCAQPTTRPANLASLRRAVHSPTTMARRCTFVGELDNSVRTLVRMLVRTADTNLGSVLIQPRNQTAQSGSVLISGSASHCHGWEPKEGRRQVYTPGADSSCLVESTIFDARVICNTLHGTTRGRMSRCRMVEDAGPSRGLTRDRRRESGAAQQ